MAKIEVEESDLVALRRVNTFAETALNNPKTRRQMLEIQKTLNPDAVIPEIDAADHVMSAVKQVSDKVDAMLTKLSERDTAADDARRTSALQEKMAAGQRMLREHSYSEEGITKIEALMLAEGIVSYAAGLALFERQNPAPPPADNSRPGRFGDMSGNDVQTDDFKKLWDSQGQSEEWLQESLGKVRADFRN